MLRPFLDAFVYISESNLNEKIQRKDNPKWKTRTLTPQTLHPETAAAVIAAATAHVTVTVHAAAHATPGNAAKHSQICSVY